MGVAQLWTESNDIAVWQRKLQEVRPLDSATLAELRSLAADDAKQKAEVKAQQANADRDRRLSKLAHGSSFEGVMPRHFAADLMVRFQLIPGWRVSNIQHALSVKMRSWTRTPEEAPAGVSNPPTTD